MIVEVILESIKDPANLARAPVNNVTLKLPKRSDGI
jgi:hypothetical protein